MFEISYVKNKKSAVPTTLEGITKMQNYIPIYQNFFRLSETNFNNINLNNRFHASRFIKKETDNKWICQVKSDTQEKKVPSFLKYSPLIDPVKYLAGKYKGMDIDILPSFKGKEGHKKIRDGNNSAYVDGFFSFLSSQVLNTHRFIHGTDFYGSFLGIKNKFKYNIIDDLEFLHESDFFRKNKDATFQLEENYEDFLEDIQTRHYRKPLKITESIKSLHTEHLDNSIFKDLFKKSADISGVQDITKNLIFTMDISTNGVTSPCSTASSKSSACSSRSSHTSHSSESSGDSSGTEFCDESSSMGSLSMSTLSDDCINATLFNFPVQIICLEALEGTLDSIMPDLRMEEWRSCFFQVIIILLVYQKLFDFTHNDLHTNNIMYKNTDAKFLFYYYNGKYYKVPTFGKVYKIIDFGRAIYKFKGNIMCSDSFHIKGDAATQYNCEPYLNPNKPRLEPNKSFDLCRLGCSLFDFFFNDPLEQIESNVDPIAQLINRWCKDDKGRNILYKKNGDERYPEFKLNKMIARHVHHCPPQKEIENTMFNKYISSGRKVNKKRVINIDKLPTYVK